MKGRSRLKFRHPGLRPLRASLRYRAMKYIPVPNPESIFHPVFTPKWIPASAGLTGVDQE